MWLFFRKEDDCVFVGGCISKDVIFILDRNVVLDCIGLVFNYREGCKKSNGSWKLERFKF